MSDEPLSKPVPAMTDHELRAHLRRYDQTVYRQAMPRALEQLIYQKRLDHPPVGTARVRLRAAMRAMDRLGAAPSPRQACHDLLSARSTGEIEFAYWALNWFGSCIAKRAYPEGLAASADALLMQAFRAGVACLDEMAEEEQSLMARRRR